MGSDPVRNRLKAAGLKVTGPRLAVLEALALTGPHSDADAITAAARAKATISTQAVYDSLSALTRVGIVRRFEPAGHPARYELRVGDNHHHVVCRSCGLTKDVDCAVGTTPCLTAGDDGGFQIDEAEVTFWGLCPECQKLTGDSGLS